MALASASSDIGLSTSNWNHAAFWQQDAAVRFDHVLPVRRGRSNTACRAGLGRQAEPSCKLLPTLRRRLPRVDHCARSVQTHGKWSIPTAIACSCAPGHDGVSQIAVPGRSQPRRTPGIFGDILGSSELPWLAGRLSPWR